MAEQTMFGGYWLPVSNFDPRVVALYGRHYSARPRVDGLETWLQRGIGGPGETLALLTRDCSALFLWRLEAFRKDGRRGINCAVFRNEGDTLSSDLIRDADQFFSAHTRCSRTSSPDSQRGSSRSHTTS